MKRSIETSAGICELPAFFPDATYGAVKACDPQDVSDSGLQGLEMNSFHLSGKPGANAVKALGGLHGFTGYKGVILTDSGGFQLFSMIRENPSYGEIREREIIFRPDGKKKTVYTPEKSIQTQFRLGSDIMMALDVCTAPDDGRSVQEWSVDLTVKWAKRCRQEFDRLSKETGRRPLLFGIVQGGAERDLREECAGRLEEIGFDGYGFGGWPLGKDGKLREDVLKMAADAMPDGKIKYAMGLGRPEEIVALTHMGYSLFDCVIPTREARHQRLYVFLPGMDTKDGVESGDFYRFMYILDEEYARDGRPVDETCDCPLCSRFSRAYLHHLFRMEDPSALRLATAHNLRFYGRLMKRLREE